LTLHSWFFQPEKGLAQIFHESASRDREDGRATGQPQGVESEAYLNSTSQVSSSEDAWKDDHIIRARCAPLSPASGFPVSRSQQPIHELFGLDSSIVGRLTTTSPYATKRGREKK
jgi:hypothetical protein